MKVLIIGGMGLIGGALTEAAVKKGMEVYVCSRSPLFGKYTSLNIVGVQGNWNDDSFAQQLVSDYFDVIVDTQVFTKKQLIRSLQIVNDHCTQYIYISTDSVYAHPASNVKEDDYIGLEQLRWSYGYNKRDAEIYILSHSKEYNFYWTGIRPTVTWGETRFPVGFASKRNTNTSINRLIEGKPILLFDDINAKHAICRVSIIGNAVVDLFLNENAKEQFYHVSDDKAYTYMEIYKIVEDILGIKGKYVHLPSKILKKYNKNLYEEMIYDKDPEFTLDNKKIKKESPNTNYSPNLYDVLKPTIENLKKSLDKDYEYDIIPDLLLYKYNNYIIDETEKEIAKKYISSFKANYEHNFKKYDIYNNIKRNRLLKLFGIAKFYYRNGNENGENKNYTVDRGGRTATNRIRSGFIGLCFKVEEETWADMVA